VSEPDVVLVLTTLPADHDARSLASTLVEERLAACATILGEVHSVYRWEGKIASEREQQLIIKTTAARAPALVARIKELHPYTLPEIIVVPTRGGLDAYTRWVSEMTI